MPHSCSHGGRCCGIQHIYGFISDRNNIISRECFLNYKGVQEIVLTDRQVKAKYMRDVLAQMKELGFEYISRFRNPNTGNMCNIFHRYVSTVSGKPTKQKLLEIEGW